MAPPLIKQLQFTRADFIRSLDTVTEEEATRIYFPMNPISWNICHVACQEQRHLLKDTPILPEITTKFGWGSKPSTPTLTYAWDVWNSITKAVDKRLAEFSEEDMMQEVFMEDEGVSYVNGNAIQKIIYHYWYHLGECMAIRQLYGTKNLYEPVGDLDHEAPYASTGKNRLRNR